MRQYSDIQARKRAGVDLNLDSRATTKKPIATQGQLALSCPSCPRPGFNLPPKWKEDKRK